MCVCLCVRNDAQRGWLSRVCGGDTVRQRAVCIVCVFSVCVRREDESSEHVVCVCV